MTTFYLAVVNEEVLEQFEEDFNQDWSNTNNPLPDTGQIIGPYEVLALKELYMTYGEPQMLINLFTQELGIPMRHNTHISHFADTNGQTISQSKLLITYFI